MKRKADKKTKPDEDEVPRRTQCREIFEGSQMTIFMGAVTIFALFGDDLRFLLFPKAGDIYIEIALFLSLLAFAIEILANSCVVDDFKYSFFFWLDIIATASIVTDISFLTTPFYQTVGFD